MIRVVKPQNDVVLSNGIFLRRGAVRTVDISDNEWQHIAPAVVDLTPTGVETPAPERVEKPNGENDIQHTPKKGKKQTVKNELA